jgi:hypothetical protein
MQAQEQTTMQSVEATAGQIIDVIKDVVREGNVRKVSIKQDGKTIAEFPLTFGIVGAAVARLGQPSARLPRW